MRNINKQCWDSGKASDVSLSFCFAFFSGASNFFRENLRMAELKSWTFWLEFLAFRN